MIPTKFRDLNAMNVDQTLNVPIKSELFFPYQKDIDILIFCFPIKISFYLRTGAKIKRKNSDIIFLRFFPQKKKKFLPICRRRRRR